MKTAKYNTITSALNTSSPGFDTYIEMCKRIELFIETDGASENDNNMANTYMAEFAVLQDQLYKQAIEKKRNESC